MKKTIAMFLVMVLCFGMVACRSAKPAPTDGPTVGSTPSETGNTTESTGQTNATVESAAATQGTVYTKVEASAVQEGFYLLGGTSRYATDDGSTDGFITGIFDSKGTRLTVSIQAASGNQIANEDKNLVWQLIAANGGFYVKNAGTGRYLYYGDGKENVIFDTADRAQAGVWKVVSHDDVWTLEELSSGRQLSVNSFGSKGSKYLGAAAYSAGGSTARSLTFYALTSGSVTPNEATPDQKPAEKPTQAPTQKPTQAPAQKPTQAPTQKPTQAPAQKPTEGQQTGGNLQGTVYTKVAAGNVQAGFYLLGGTSKYSIDDGSTDGFISGLFDGKDRLTVGTLTTSGNQAANEDKNYVWQFIATSGGFYIKNAGTGRYLYHGTGDKNVIFDTASQSEAGVWKVVAHDDVWTLEEVPSGRHLSLNAFGSEGSKYLGAAAYSSTSSTARSLTFYVLTSGSVTPNEATPDPQPTEKPTQAPTQKPTEGSNSGSSTGEVTYVLNTDSKKFHKPTCRYADNKHREDSTLSKEELEAMGYEACKTCKP